MSVARVMDGLGSLSKLEQEELNLRLAEVRPTEIELGPTFHRVFGKSKRQATRLAEAYATSLPEIAQHRQVFQAIAPRAAEERQALIAGYRAAGHVRWVVAAIGELPAAQGRTLMRDFVKADAARHDRRAVKDVLLYLAEVG